MPVIGAVLHLDQEQEPREKALSFIEQHPMITPGVRQGGQLPIVVESASRQEDKAIWEQLKTTRGITFSAIVFADFSDIIDEESP